MKKYDIKIDQYDLTIVLDALDLYVSAADIFAEDATYWGDVALRIARDLKKQAKMEDK